MVPAALLKLILVGLVGGGTSVTAWAQIEYDADGIATVDPDESQEPRKELRRQKKKRLKKRVRKRVQKKRATKASRRLKKRRARQRAKKGPARRRRKAYNFDWERYDNKTNFFERVSGVGLRPGRIGAEVAFEGRAFEAVDNQDLTADQNAALFARLTVPFESKQGDWAARIKGFGRIDAIDEERRQIFPEDIYFGYTKGFFRARAGFQVYNWTQMDIFSPAELLNSVNFDSEVENLEQIGELSLSLQFKLTFGFLEAVYMPFFLKPGFPGRQSRFSILPLGEEMGDPIVAKKNGPLVERTQFHQFGLRFSRSLGDADLNLFFLDQIDRRSPVIVTQASTGALRPVFFPIASLGASLVYSWRGWLFKAESVRRLVTNPLQPTIFGELKKKSHSLVALGVERGYELFGFEWTGLLEYQTLFGVSDLTDDLEKQQITPFQNDLALGFRINFNDIKGREIKFLAILDFDRSDQLLASLSYRQRLFESWEVDLGYRLIKAPPQIAAAPVGLEQFDRDNYGFLSLRYNY